ncbi:MAG: hypothetical protein LBI45_04500 [Bacteroidales bacterium]|jgi:hypothetical protein|nr:hypothetical protein [Bacteroidales bacterium]
MLNKTNNLSYINQLNTLAYLRHANCGCGTFFSTGLTSLTGFIDLGSCGTFFSTKLASLTGFIGLGSCGTFFSTELQSLMGFSDCKFHGVKIIDVNNT